MLKMTARYRPASGVASLDAAREALAALFKRADLALYVAERGSRNRVVADAAIGVRSPKLLKDFGIQRYWG